MIKLNQLKSTSINFIDPRSRFFLSNRSSDKLKKTVPAKFKQILAFIQGICSSSKTIFSQENV